jgi:hypothetical protein
MPRGHARQQVTLRLDHKLYVQLVDEAKRRGVPLIDYLRFCVERGHQGEAVASQIGELRYLVEQVAGAATGTPTSSNASTTVIDIRQALRAELAATKSSGQAGGSASPPGMSELLTATFVVEELVRESVAGRNPTAIRGAMERARARATEALGRK